MELVFPNQLKIIACVQKGHETVLSDEIPTAQSAGYLVEAIANFICVAHSIVEVILRWSWNNQSSLVVLP